MAIKMVREPSETPNIRNIDDIIGLRYAYGNQDGYVIGKGNELSYSINGSAFTINSGRVVLQGVESDIDANGVSISVDNVAELRYFIVYYKVNLATNTASIESTYDTVSFPSISSGDDLTKNANGIANLVLYHFTAQNGAIQNVEKIVKPIEYINKNTKVNNAVNSENATNATNSINATKVNNLEITRDSNGVLRIGDVIIPQKKLIWSGNLEVTESRVELDGLPTINLGDILILKLKVTIWIIVNNYERYSYDSFLETKVVVTNFARYVPAGFYTDSCSAYPFALGKDTDKCYIIRVYIPDDNQNKALFSEMTAITTSGSGSAVGSHDYTLLEIYKVIE